MINVAILGATGMVGQRFITLLENHPYFNVKKLAASPRSKGKKYSDVMKSRWKLDTAIPEYAKEMIIHDLNEVSVVAEDISLVFCAIDLDTDEIIRIEEAYAKSEIIVVSNNSANRWTDDVPMIIPEINSNHLDIIDTQKKRLGTSKGFIVTKPNCSIQSYVGVLKALEQYKPKKMSVCTYQAISGSGKTFEQWPEMVDNLIPYISGEEKKSELEPLKILASVENGRFNLKQELEISAQCLRVPITDGHMAAVSISFENKPSIIEFKECIENYKLPQFIAELPHSPSKFMTIFEEDSRPQTKLDRDLYGGMGISIGRIREDNLFDYKFVALSHNTLRGAAGGALLVAEMLYKMIF